MWLSGMNQGVPEREGERNRAILERGKVEKGFCAPKAVFLCSVFLLNSKLLTGAALWGPSPKCVCVRARVCL